MSDSKRPVERIEYEFNHENFMHDLRITYGKTLRDIEDKTGISASTLSRIDNGKLPDLDTLMRACSLLDVNPGIYFRRAVWTKTSEGLGEQS